MQKFRDRFLVKMTRKETREEANYNEDPTQKVFYEVPYIVDYGKMIEGKFNKCGDFKYLMRMFQPSLMRLEEYIMLIYIFTEVALSV